MFLEGKIIIYIEKVDSFHAKTVVSHLKQFQIKPKKNFGTSTRFEPMASALGETHTLAPALPMYGS